MCFIHSALSLYVPVALPLFPWTRTPFCFLNIFVVQPVPRHLSNTTCSGHITIDGMQARSQDNSEASESLPVSDGVKQGCVLAQTLFRLLVFSAMLTDAFRDRDVEWESDIEEMASASTSGGFRKKKKTQGHDRHHQGLSVCRRLRAHLCLTS